MNSSAIRVEHLSKKYEIGAQQTRHNTLRDRLVDGVKSLTRRNSRASAPTSFWALQDVSFDIQRGEVVGIIGRNGAGKSTLLKILSRITEPTSGQALIRGRVGSLLEVGTGFHPELTGRENIYLNGAIIGMARMEISQKFDAIVDFAGVEKFIDTPVKRYSSGMYVRLAFAVAAHLETEIVLVDEVLAVGDAAFQKKCLGTMNQVAKSGRTVVFVSHNMAAIENLCTSAILMEGGRVVMQGDSHQVIHHYLEHALPSLTETVPLAQREDRSGNGTIRLTSFRVEDIHGNRLPAVSSGMDVTFVFGYECRDAEPPASVDVGFSLSLANEELLTVLYSSYVGQTFAPESKSGEFRCRLPKLPLAAGRYSVGARLLAGGEEADWLRNSVGYVDVELGDFYGSGSPGFNGAAPMLLDGQWSMQEIRENAEAIC
jgi:lipopolysaccharide transport system ATP-binding protein